MHSGMAVSLPTAVLHCQIVMMAYPGIQLTLPDFLSPWRKKLLQLAQISHIGADTDWSREPPRAVMTPQISENCPFIQLMKGK